MPMCAHHRGGISLGPDEGDELAQGHLAGKCGGQICIQTPLMLKHSSVGVGGYRSHQPERYLDTPVGSSPGSVYQIPRGNELEGEGQAGGEAGQRLMQSPQGGQCSGSGAGQWGG